MIVYSLSVPQRIVAGCIVATAIISIIILGTISWQSWSKNQPRPIKVLAVSDVSHIQGSEDGNPTIGFNFDEIITLRQGFVDIESTGRRIVAAGPASFSLNSGGVKFTQGTGFVAVTNQTNLVGNSTLSVANVSGVFDAGQQQFVIFNGLVSLNGNQLGPNRAISLRQATPGAGSFDRSVLSTAWAALRDVVIKQGLAPQSLSDITPPTLTMTPISGSTVAAAELTLTGSFNENIANLLINGEPVAIQNSRNFTLTVTMQIGTNSINIIAVDGAGNQLTTAVEYVGSLLVLDQALP